MESERKRVRPALGLVAVALLTIPWLQSFAFGPTTAVLQWISTGIGLSLWWLLCRSSVLFSHSQSQRIVEIAWLAAACLSAVMGLMQYFAVVGSFDFLVSAAQKGQAYANLRQRNQFATLLNIGIATVLLGSHFCAPAKWDTSRQKTCNVMLALMVIGFASANVASGSRTGLAQLVLVLAFACLWRVSFRNVTIALVSYGIAAIVLPSMVGGYQMAGGILVRFAEETASCSSRLTLWSNVLHLIAQKPWLGWGWGELDYAHFMTLYPGERFCEILDNAHNLPLHLAVELGVPVAAVFCGVCAWLVWRNKPWAETDPTRQLVWGVLAVIGLHSMLEYPLWYGPFQLAVVLCIWLLWRGRGVVEEPEQALPLDGSRFVRAATGTAAVSLLALCTYAAWDYWCISQIYLPPAARNAAYKEDTLAKIQGSRLFRDQVRFAELTTTPLNESNAAHLHALAKEMLHFSPEPRVVEKVIESAVMLRQDDEALYYLQRYQAAFPEPHARWSAAFKMPKPD